MSDSSDGRVSPVLVGLAFLVVCVVWGSTYLAMLFAIETIPPFLMVSFRFLLAGAILFPIAWRRSGERIGWRQWWSSGLAGTLMLCGGTGMVAWSEQHISSASASVLVATVPLWLVVLDWLLFRGGRPSVLVVFGLGSGLLGVLLMIGPGEVLGERLDVRGVICILCGCVFWSLGSLYSRSGALPKSTFLASAMEMLVAGVVSVLIALILGQADGFVIGAVSTKSWLAVLYLVFAGSLLAFSAYSWLMRVASPSLVGTYAYINPLVAMLLGITLGGEILPLRAWLGAAVILGSVVLISTVGRSGWRRQSPRPVASRSCRGVAGAVGCEE